MKPRDPYRVCRRRTAGVSQRDLHYENERPGLGGEFSQEVHAALDTLREFPEVGPTIEGDLRRYRIDRFPYGVVYAVRGDLIVIIAVMHLHRRPGYWRGRVS